MIKKISYLIPIACENEKGEVIIYFLDNNNRVLMNSLGEKMTTEFCEQVLAKLSPSSPNWPNSQIWDEIADIKASARKQIDETREKGKY